MTLEQWDISLLMDWSRRRDEMKPLFYSISGYNMATYSTLTASEKLIGAKYFLVPYGLRVLNGVVTEAQDSINWEFLLTETKDSRIACIEAMRLFIGEQIRTNKVSLLNTHVFNRDVFEFINWFNRANAPDFKQWLINETGSKYEFKGFKNTSYWSQDIQDGLMNIYNGNY